MCYVRVIQLTLWKECGYLIEKNVASTLKRIYALGDSHYFTKIKWSFPFPPAFVVPIVYGILSSMHEFRHVHIYLLCT